MNEEVANTNAWFDRPELLSPAFAGFLAKNPRLRSAVDVDRILSGGYARTSFEQTFVLLRQGTTPGFGADDIFQRRPLKHNSAETLLYVQVY